MEVREVFSAEPKSTWHILCESNTGFYVPAYQREYSWNKDNIIRLFDDTCHGIRLLLDNEDAITFIGTIIYIHDIRYQTVNPIVRTEVPGKVCVVIDGQQRLTTLLLLNSIIHNDIVVFSKRLKTSTEPQDVWLYQKALSTMSQLAKTYEFDMDYGDSQWYPRMIRAYDDSWSRSSSTAKYSSPIATYLHKYGKHTRDIENSSKAFKYELGDIPSESLKKHEVIKDNIKHIVKYLREIYKDNGSDFDFPKLTEIYLSQPHFKEVLIGPEIPDYVKASLDDPSTDRYFIEYRSLFRLILFARYLLERIAVTIVGAKNESYAFDMFESLNTTGEPLTAYETFKPRVIDSEGLAQYEHSESRLHMSHIEDYLNAFKKAQDKHDATSELVIPFALAESGFKLSKRLSDQRRYLKDRYDANTIIDDKRGFVKHFGHSSLVINYSWPADLAIRPKFYQLDDISDEAILCLDLLRSSKHNITLALIIRYFSLTRLLSGEDRNRAIADLECVIKSIAAFSVLWRASRKGTEGIDSIYRELMKDGVTEIGIGPFSRTTTKNTGITYNDLPTAEQLRTAFKHHLKKRGLNCGNIEDKTEWVTRSKAIPLYDINKPITRFILLAASHDSCLDADNLGLLKQGREGILPTLNYSEWEKLKKEDYTVEHIAPQTPLANSDWDRALYEEKETVDMIGNLTLLPRSENSIVGNRNWADKKLMYEICSADTQDDFDRYLLEARTMGIELPQATIEKLKGSKYLAHVKAISKLNDNWNKDFVMQRSKRLLELAWDRIIPWLGDF
ncbi:MAG: DUF262 domain-containing protein [Geobacter sp.]|nr:MAG: DUF262 domain-containing protein [Geobacter sp.]